MNTTTIDITAAAATPRGTYIDASGVEELVDDSYQRPADMAQARRLPANWERRPAGVIEVSDRGPDQNPRHAIGDGQHRWEAARSLHPSPMMVATIPDGLGVADEARLFDRLNRQRYRLCTWDHRRAREAAGDDAVTTIKSVVQRAGLIIDSAPKDGHIRCTCTLEKLEKLGGPDLIGDTLDLVSDVWGERSIDAFDAPIVHGVGLVLHYRKGPIDLARLGEVLLDVLPRQLKTQALALRDITTRSQRCARRDRDHVAVMTGEPADAPTSSNPMTRRRGGGPALLFVQLNPSTADADRDDPTVRRDMGFADGFGHHAFTGLNLYAGKATEPRDLAAMGDPVGPENDAYLDRAAAEHDVIVFAWGATAEPGRARAVASRIWRICRRTGAAVACSGFTDNNQPKHPLRLRADTPLHTVTAGALLGVDPRWTQLLADTTDIDEDA